jgi:hypothetical protein
MRAGATGGAHVFCIAVLGHSYFTASAHKEAAEIGRLSSQWAPFMMWLKDFKGGHAPPPSANHGGGQKVTHSTCDRWLQVRPTLRCHALCYIWRMHCCCLGMSFVVVTHLCLFNLVGASRYCLVLGTHGGCDYSGAKVTGGSDLPKICHTELLMAFGAFRMRARHLDI